MRNDAHRPLGALRSRGRFAPRLVAPPTGQVIWVVHSPRPPVTRTRSYTNKDAFEAFKNKIKSSVSSLAPPPNVVRPYIYEPRGIHLLSRGASSFKAGFETERIERIERIERTEPNRTERTSGCKSPCAQVLRRFRDDGNAVHLINAGKYVSGVLAVTAGLCLRYVEENDTARGGALLFLSRGTGRVDDAAVAAATGWRHAYNVATYAARGGGVVFLSYTILFTPPPHSLFVMLFYDRAFTLDTIVSSPVTTAHVSESPRNTHRVSSYLS